MNHSDKQDTAASNVFSGGEFQTAMCHPATRDAYPIRNGASGDAFTVASRIFKAEHGTQACVGVAIGSRARDVRPTAVGIDATAAP